MNPIPDRMLNKIALVDGCWEWQGALDQNGYSMVQMGEKCQRAHRVIYELLRELIPDGMEIDHLCRNRRCVNPNHLEPVTHRENTMRGDTIVAKWAARTHCDKCGSELEIAPRSGPPRRFCRTCKNRQSREASWNERRARGAEQRKHQSGM